QLDAHVLRGGDLRIPCAPDIDLAAGERSDGLRARAGLDERHVLVGIEAGFGNHALDDLDQLRAVRDHADGFALEVGNRLDVAVGQHDRKLEVAAHVQVYRLDG